MNDKPLIFKVRVRELRKQSDLTQEALADILGVSRQSVIALENGKYLPSLPIAMQLAEIFSHPLEEIFIADNLDFTMAKSMLPAYYPPINLRHDEGCLVLEAAVAGYNKDEVEVEVEPEQVTIVGNQRGPEPGTYLAKEIAGANFKRQLRLPALVDPDSSKASINDGLLTITMPLLAQAQSKKKLNIK